MVIDFTEMLIEVTWVTPEHQKDTDYDMCHVCHMPLDLQIKPQNFQSLSFEDLNQSIYDQCYTRFYP